MVREGWYTYDKDKMTIDEFRAYEALEALRRISKETHLGLLTKDEARKQIEDVKKKAGEWLFDIALDQIDDGAERREIIAKRIQERRKKMNKKIVRLEKAVRDKNTEHANLLYFSILRELAFHSDPELVKELDDMVGDAIFWKVVK